MLERADPVDVGCQRMVPEDGPLGGGRRADVKQPRLIDGRRRPTLVRGMERDGARQANAGGGCGDAPRQLKSLREKITIAPNSSAATYSAAYPNEIAMYCAETGRPWTTASLTSNFAKSGST